MYRDLRNIAFYDNGGEGPPVFTIDGVETLSFDTLREMVLEAAAAGEGAR